MIQVVGMRPDWLTVMEYTHQQKNRSSLRPKGEGSHREVKEK